jgi:hypothetical protein
MISFFTPVYGNLLMTQFQNMAETITAEYIEDLYKEINEKGTTPSFDYLMQKVKELNDDLNRRAIWIREDYKEERMKKSTRLTKACKKIVSKSVNDFACAAKLVLNTSVRREPSSEHLTIKSRFQ